MTISSREIDNLTSLLERLHHDRAVMQDRLDSFVTNFKLFLLNSAPTITTQQRNLEARKAYEWGIANYRAVYTIYRDMTDGLREMDWTLEALENQLDRNHNFRG